MDYFRKTTEQNGKGGQLHRSVGLAAGWNMSLTLGSPEPFTLLLVDKLNFFF